MKSSSSSRSRSRSRERRKRTRSRSRSYEKQKRSRYENERSYRKNDSASKYRDTDSHRRSKDRESRVRSDKNDVERWPNDKYFEMGRETGSNRDRKGFGYHKNVRKGKDDDFMDARRLQREAIGEEGIAIAWAKSPVRQDE